MVLENRPSLTDDEIVLRVCAGETNLYELLMRRYNQRLFRVIRSVITNDLEAEDVLQDAWVRAFEHLKQFESRASFATWVTKIAFHEALARLRKGKRFSALEDGDGEIMFESRFETKSEDPEKQAIRGELGQVLQSAVDRLPEAYRAVFVLREVEEMSTADTAQCLSLSEEAVKTRLHRSRAMLRRDLEDQIGPAIAQAYAFRGSRCDGTVSAVMQRIQRTYPAPTTSL